MRRQVSFECNALRAPVIFNSGSCLSLAFASQISGRTVQMPARKWVGR
jgi:hypothetical protein